MPHAKTQRRKGKRKQRKAGLQAPGGKSTCAASPATCNLPLAAIFIRIGGLPPMAPVLKKALEDADNADETRTNADERKNRKMICANPRCEASASSAFPFFHGYRRAAARGACFEYSSISRKGAESQREKEAKKTLAFFASLREIFIGISGRPPVTPGWETSRDEIGEKRFNDWRSL